MCHLSQFLCIYYVFYIYLIAIFYKSCNSIDSLKYNILANISTMKYSIILTMCIISEINVILGCHSSVTKILPYNDPNFNHMNSLPNIYNWDQMMVFIPVNQDPKYNVIEWDQNNTFWIIVFTYDLIIYANSFFRIYLL